MILMKVKLSRCLKLIVESDLIPGLLHILMLLLPK